MAENLRSVAVRVTIDTSKRTEILDRDDLDIPEMETEIREFIEGLGYTLPSQEILNIALDTIKRIADGNTNNPTTLARATLATINRLADEGTMSPFPG